MHVYYKSDSNELELEFEYFREGMEKMFESTGLQKIEIPWFS